MRKSKFVGKEFDNGWKCVAIYLAANYGSCTAHNRYRYQMARITSDNKCDKIITITGSTMTKIYNGELTVESVAQNKKESTRQINEILYKFN